MALENDGKTLVQDNTQRSTYVSCARKYYWRFVRKFVPEYGSSALRYGGSWHAFMEGYYSGIILNGFEASEQNIARGFEFAKKDWDERSEGKIYTSDYRTLENLLIAAVAYVEKFQNDMFHMKIIGTEDVFIISMIEHIKALCEQKGIDFLKAFPFLAQLELLFTGRLDLKIEFSGLKYIQEFKTTGGSAKLQAERLNRTPQGMGYIFGARHYQDFHPDGILVDISQMTSRKKVSGEYGKVTIDHQRTPQLFSEWDIEQWLFSFAMTAENIARSFALDLWPMTFDSCYQFGRCSYLNLCLQGKKKEDVITAGYLTDNWDVRNETNKGESDKSA